MIHKLLKIHPVLCLGVLCYVYLFSGLIVNFLQLLILIFIRSISEKWGTKLNGILQASHVAIFTFVVEWHCECKIRIYYKEEDLSRMGEEHTLCLCNHKGEVDWQMGYTLLERLDGLKGCKCLVKKQAMYLPVVGWYMWFTDYLFLCRDWAKDQGAIQRIAKIWANYRPADISNYYILCAEGTRFTPAKHEASIAFARERGVEPFRHVLYPRTKGAAELISELGDSLGSAQIVIFAFPGSNNPDTSTMIAGKSTDIDIFFRRVGAENIPKEKADIEKFIIEQYRDMDNLLQYHAENDAFPGEPGQSLPRRRRSLIMFYVWAALSYGLGAVFLAHLIAQQCYYMLALIGIGLVLGGLAAHKIISYATLSKSSSYGIEKKKSS